MKKYMVLILKKSYFLKYVEDGNIYETYITKNMVMELFRKIITRLFAFITPCFFGIWKNNIVNVDTIILFDNGYRPYITKYIRKKKPNIKIVFYFWNTINKRNIKALSDKNIDEIWSFDKNVAEKYETKYFPQFCNKCFKLNNENTYDVFFLGNIKDREKELNEVKNILEQKNITYEIITPSKQKKKYSYEEYLKLLSSSNVMLEIVGKKQIGLTLRAIEAQLYKKKLITNNKKINEYEFYDKNNIFVLGQDDLENLYEFVHTPYKKMDEKIINKYSYENFIKTIIK